MDIDDTVLPAQTRPLGFSLTQELVKRGGEPIFVTAREGATAKTDAAWRDTFFALYEAGLHPTVTAKKNGVMMFKPPSNYSRMSEGAKDEAVENFKEQQRKSARPLWMACGDCLWDGIPTLGETIVHLDPSNHKLFTRHTLCLGTPEGCTRRVSFPVVFAAAQQV